MSLILLNSASRQAATRLFMFASLAVLILTLVHQWVAPRIAWQQQQAQLQAFRVIAPDLTISPQILQHWQSLELNGKTLIRYPIFESRDNHFSHQADFFIASTNQGYNGNITLLLAISADGRTLLGVRVLTHQETAGLGDKIEARLSNWIDGFTRREIATTQFAVKQDGGEFDAFTGATITPRAVVNLVGEISHAYPQFPQPPLPDAPKDAP